MIIIFALAYNELPDLLEQVLNRCHIIVGWSFCEHDAPISDLLLLLSKGERHGPLTCQVTFVPDEDQVEFLVSLLQMMQPVLQLLKTLLGRDAVAEHSNLGVPQEQMRQVVHAWIAGRVPDIQLQLLRSAAFINFDALAEVGDYVRSLVL